MKLENQLISSAIMAPGSTWRMLISYLALSSVSIVPPNIQARALGLPLFNVSSPGTVDVSGQKVRLAMEQHFSSPFRRITINDMKVDAILLLPEA
jgi:hypothetical protein